MNQEVKSLNNDVPTIKSRIESFRASPVIKILASDTKPLSRLSTLEQNSPAFFTTRAGQASDVVNMFDLQNQNINKTTDWNSKQRNSMALMFN